MINRAPDQCSGADDWHYVIMEGRGGEGGGKEAEELEGRREGRWEGVRN